MARSPNQPLKPNQVQRSEARRAADTTPLPHDIEIDPYLVWAVWTDFKHLGERENWYPVLLELAEGTTPAKFGNSVHNKRDRNWIRVPAIYRRPPRELHDAQLSFCTALMRKSALTALVTERGSRRLVESMDRHLQSVERLEFGSGRRVTFERGKNPVFSETPPPKLPTLATTPAKRVIVGIIDDVLAFAHERFRKADGKTRFKYFWNQDDDKRINAPKGFGWGSEFTGEDIDRLLQKHTYSGMVDEDALYECARQKLAARRCRHGTHVMDLACGLDPREVGPTSPYLIGVQLPNWVVTETSGGLLMLTPAVLQALDYILACADDIAAAEGTGPLPIVVNLSYGVMAGPHDGTAPLEAAMDQLVRVRSAPLRIVLPAGNDYLRRCHARIEFPKEVPEKIHSLQWRVQPNDESASFMRIWLPRHPSPAVEVRITTPEGTASPWIGPGECWPWPDPKHIRFFAIYCDKVRAGGRPNILLGIAPTEQLATQPPCAPAKSVPPTAPSGNWYVEVRRNPRADRKTDDIRVDAWMERGDTPYGYPVRGRQARFDDPDYVRFDLAGRPEQKDVRSSYIRRKGTINALATGREVIVVGGFRQSDYSATGYSSAGPLFLAPGTVPWRKGPDVTAVADDSPGLCGVLAAGTRSGSVFAMNGTSVAAPRVTRLIAQLMTDALANNVDPGLASNRNAVKDYAARNDPSPAHRLPQKRGGAGRIDAPGVVPGRWTRWD
jgi:hypothetical protein